jgi:glutamine amidotransferase
MCRWLAYSGGEIPLAELIFNTRHSLIDQSLSSTYSDQTTNGDGFGVGWYDAVETPGMYKNVQPAWNDANLHDLCTHVKSSLFFAHVRASTGTAIQYTNCHPFRDGRHLFVHNGLIDGFASFRRELSYALDDEHFQLIAGSTDSELMFLLALQYGLAEDVYSGIARMVGLVERLGREKGVANPMQMTLGISDGARLHAVRYSSGGKSRSLYHSRDLHTIEVELEPRSRSLLEQMTENARCVVSEPLSENMALWEPIAESTFLTIEDGRIEYRDFQPIAA